MAKNDTRAFNHVQIHDLRHFLGGNMSLLNLYLVLLLEWSIVHSSHWAKIRKKVKFREAELFASNPKINGVFLEKKLNGE